MNVIETLRNMPVILQVITVFPLCLVIYAAVILAVNITVSVLVYVTKGRKGWEKWMEKKYDEKIKEIEKKKRY
jgi:hypothetical protein